MNSTELYEELEQVLSTQMFKHLVDKRGMHIEDYGDGDKLLEFNLGDDALGAAILTCYNDNDSDVFSSAFGYAEKLDDSDFEDFFVGFASTSFGGTSDEFEILREIAEDQNEYSLEELLEEDFEDGSYFGSFRIGDIYEGFYKEEDAVDAAVQYTLELFDEIPDIISEGIEKGWALSFIDEGRAKDFFEQVYNEWNYSYAEDIESESASDDEYENRLQEEMAGRGVDNIDDFVESLTEDQLGDDGGYSYYASDFGDEEAGKLLIDNNLIDLQAAAEHAVDTDGWAHGLSHYDGNYSGLPSGAVYYKA